MIVSAYKKAREASKQTVLKQRVLDRPAVNSEQTELQQLKSQINNWLLLWERWQYNAGRMGWDTRELEKPLPEAIHRKLPKQG